MASAPTNHGTKTGYNHIRPSSPGSFQEEGAQSWPNQGGYPTGRDNGTGPQKG